jgi:hypothetical protein
MHLSVIKPEHAGIVDDDARVEGISTRIHLHNGETAPNAVVGAGLLERRDLGSVERAHDSGIGVHRQAVQRVFWKHHEVHRRHVASRFSNHRNDALCLGGKIIRRLHCR